MRSTNAWIEIGYFDERPVQRVRNAVVEIGVRTIFVEMREDARLVRFEGARTGQGHFLLRGDNGAGDATLHRFKDSTILEGFWKRNSKSGFWRVHLPQDALSDVIRLPGPEIPATRARRKNS